jgi:hypothetical protein
VGFKSDTRDPAVVFHIAPPLQGSANDPRTIGATIAMYNSVGPGGELVIVGLPPVGWTATGPNSYTYKGDKTAAITGATFKTDLIAFKGGKAQWIYTLNEPSQGRVATAFIVGNTFYCADAPAKTGAKNDRVDKFVAEPNTPAPFFCVGP